MLRPLLIVGLCFLSGCTTPLALKSMPWSSSEKKLTKSKFAPPARMVAIWTPTTLTQTGKPPTRGLGGRLYFYDENSQAIAVEGQLMVYAYNDSRLAALGEPQSPGGNTQPDRKYAFTPEQFAKYFTPSELGASYSIWIPWDPVGGEQVEVSLVPVFTAASGQIVIGQSSRHVLSGNKKTETTRFEPMAKNSSTIQPVTYEAPATSLPPTERHVTREGFSTATIALTPSLLSHLRESDPPATQSPAMQSNVNPTVVSAASVASLPSATAETPAWTPPDPRSNHFVRPRHPVLTAPRPQPTVSPAQWQPGPIVSPSGPALSPALPMHSSVPATSISAPEVLR
jgi:hypothetical protein